MLWLSLTDNYSWHRERPKSLWVAVEAEEITMAGRIKIRAQKKGELTEVKALMRHPMETGMRKDQAGESIPAHFITEVSVLHGDQAVMQAHWGAAVSANPFLGVRFQGGQAGDAVRVVWTDNQGGTGEGETTIR
jgi:sulfur-oxidizing protein SoxZ